MIKTKIYHNFVSNYRKRRINTSRGAAIRPLIFSIIFHIVMFSSLGNAKAEMPTFIQLTESEGVTQRTVQSVLQDRSGFLWFGTRDGLLRYNGYTSVEYRYDHNRKDSLGNNSVYFILEDRLGHIWIATEGGGLNKYVPESDSFIRYQYDPTNHQGLSQNEIVVILEDRNGFLWIGSNSGGVSRFDPKSEIFTHYRHEPDNPNSLSNDTVWHLYEDREGILWFATYGGGLDRFDPTTENFTHYRHDPKNPKSIASDTVGAILEDQKGYLWVGGREGLNKLDKETGEFTRFTYDQKVSHSLTYNYVWDIIQDSQGFLWLGLYGGGLNKFDPSTGKVVESYTNIPSDPNSLGSNLIWQIFEDKVGTIWLATEGAGVNKLSKRARSFGRYVSTSSKTVGLQAGMISSISEGQNNILWLANTEGGFQKIDRTNKITSQYLHQPGNLNSLKHNNSQSIIEDKNKVVWIGTYGGGLNRFDPKTEAFTHYIHNPKDPTSISDDRIWSVYEDRKENLWIGTLNGLNRMGPSRKKIERILHDPQNPHSLSSNRVWTTYEDSKGNLWVGTGHGLNYKALGGHQFKHYLHDPANNNSLIDNIVMAIIEDSAGKLWIGTNGGISVFDPTNGTFISYTEKDGLVSNSVRGIMNDEFGNIWITTKKGLSKFNTKTSRFTTYGKKDGLQDNEFYSGAICKTKSGELIIGGTNGINIFFPEKITDNTNIPPVVLTKFSIKNQPVALGPLLSSKKDFSLSSKDKVFSFEFATLDYANPTQNKYAYKLDGFDKDWIYSDSRKREATYTNINPGQYTFRVKGSNNDGLWNKKGVSVHLTIIPQWWQTWLFRIFIFVSAGAGLFGIYILRVRSLHLKKRQFKQLVIERTKELRQSEEELLKANDGLECRVNERTAELRDSEERHIEAQSIAHIGHWELNLITNDLFWSDELYKIFEIDKEKFGASYEAFLDSIHPDDRDYVNKAYTDSLKNKSEYDIVHRLLFEDGRIKYVNERCRTEYDEQGKPLRSIGTTQDITQRKQAEEEKRELEKQLIQTQKMESIGTLAGGIAHDFNNILSAILGFGEMVQDDLPPESDTYEMQEKVLKAAGRAKDLVQQILLFSRQTDQEISPVQPHLIIKEAMSLLRSSIPTTIEIKQNVPSDCGSILGDPTQIHQIIMNLCTNAYHAMREKGGVLGVSLATLEITAADISFISLELDPGNYIKLEVADTGQGMDQITLEKIFNPYFTTKPKGEGTGLGLSVVHGIVKNWGGQIKVYSEPGKGTTINIYFPRVASEIDPLEAQTVKPLPKGKERILVVDDEAVILDMAQRMLENLGYRVTSFISSPNALKAFQALPNDFDLIITDMTMPHMTGLELTKRVFAIRPEMPVIMCTGFSDLISEEQANALGIKGFLTKPVLRRDMANTIRNALA